MKKQTAWVNLSSVCSYSSSVISLNTRRGGVLMAIIIIPIAIPKRTRKLISKERNLSESQTTMYSNAISFEVNESDKITLIVS